MYPGEARLRLTCALLVLSCGLARAGSICTAPGAVRLVPAAGAAEGAAEPLCLDTGSAGPPRLLLARCEPQLATQWWAGTSLQQLAQADTGKCVSVTEDKAATTRACAASPRHDKRLRSVINHDALGRLVLSDDGGCLSPSAETSDAAVLVTPCSEHSARWELPACADPPPLLSSMQSIAMHKPAVMSSSSAFDAAGAVDGWPEEHGCDASRARAHTSPAAQCVSVLAKVFGWLTPRFSSALQLDK